MPYLQTLEEGAGNSGLKKGGYIKVYLEEGGPPCRPWRKGRGLKTGVYIKVHLEEGGLLCRPWRKEGGGRGLH